MKYIAQMIIVAGICSYITGCGGGGAPVKAQITYEPQSAQGFGLTVVVNECNKSGSNVSCKYLVTSEGQDRSWAIYVGKGWRDRKSNIFDNLGNEYNVNTVMIGNQVNKMGKWSNIVADVPTAGVITISNVDTRATTIKKIKMVTTVKLRDADYNNYEIFSPEFSVIPIN